MQARFFDAVTSTCNLCPRHCKIYPGNTGFCGVRKNTGKVLITWTYGAVTASGIDPIEKKPLYHFLPGSGTLSISTFGCNFTCKHCQNYTLSQTTDIETFPVTPEEVVRAAQENTVKSISFTYNEPTVYYEYMYDIARLAKKVGIPSAMITNGYLTEDALRELVPYVDVFRVDLKAFTDKFYQTICGGAHLQPVLDTISLVKELKKHLELVTLIIPGLNNDEEEINNMLSWEIENLGYAVPHHFTAFRPMYHMLERDETSPEILNLIWNKAKMTGLYYPYLGNIMHQKGSTTFCPKCGEPLIYRAGYVTKIYHLVNGKCQNCGYKIEGVF